MISSALDIVKILLLPLGGSRSGSLVTRCENNSEGHESQGGAVP